MNVSVVIPTRGDVDMRLIAKSLAGLPLEDGYIWNNGGRDEDMGVYARYAAIENVTAQVVYTQDDDCVLPSESMQKLLDAYEPGKVVCNVPARFRKRYHDSGLVGFGAIFDRYLPQVAFRRFASYVEGATPQDLFLRTCDIVFTMLTPMVQIDLPYEDLPQAHAENRMWRQPNHFEEREEVRELCRRIREQSRAVVL